MMYKPFTPARFEQLVKEFQEQEAKILSHKGNEYSDQEDRLLNFHQVAEFLGRTPAEVALSYLPKHIQSIALAVRTGQYAWAWETEGGEGLKQRIEKTENHGLSPCRLKHGLSFTKRGASTMMARHQNRVRLTRHFTKRTYERRPMPWDVLDIEIPDLPTRRKARRRVKHRLRIEIARELTEELRKGAKPDKHGAIHLTLSDGYRAIVTPEFEGCWNAVTFLEPIDTEGGELE